jgi:hypothetical protein
VTSPAVSASEFPPLPTENPFCSRHVRPGATSYRFAAGESLDAVLTRLEEHAWRGEIVGPHGSGKSSLLTVLVPALQAAGRNVQWFELHDGQRKLPEGWDAPEQCPAGTILVIDGYEQLVASCKRQILKTTARQQCGVVVTAHAASGLPPIVHTSTTLALAQDIVVELMAGRPAVITRDDVADCFGTSGGNLREMLFALYDRYEARTRQSEAADGA